MSDAVHLGFEVGTGKSVEIPLRHLAVTGQTSESGKTTTLEALVTRANATALAFITKRGESSFADGRRIQPYFRDRADWQFVTSIIDATLQEKNKFLRPWIMKICRTTETLAEVQVKVREALKTARGMNEGVYTQLDAYLDLIVPAIRRTHLADTLDLQPGLNVMDLGELATPMQMLMVQSALDWVNTRARDTVVVIPEAWEFVPEGKGSPVKASAVDLVRKGAAIGNRIWVDSQDMAGVDKVILRGCTVWLIGVQREANEIKRNLSNIPHGTAKPTAAQVALLERGQFYACWGSHAIKTYVQPAWMDEETAQAIARGEKKLVGRIKRTVTEQDIKRVTPNRTALTDTLERTLDELVDEKFPSQQEDQVNEKEARELREENQKLKEIVQQLREQLSSYERRELIQREVEPRYSNGDEDGLYQRIRDRLAKEAPKLLRLLQIKQEIEVSVTRETVTMDGKSLRGRVARLLAAGFFDEGVMQTQVRSELERRGAGVSDAKNLPREIGALVEMGFLTIEDGKDSKGRERKLYQAVADMKINVVEGR